LESHICITQTSIEGLGGGYRACVVSDAVSSRKPGDKAISLERMRQSGVVMVSTEMLIYELLRKAGTPEFKEALKLVKMWRHHKFYNWWSITVLAKRCLWVRRQVGLLLEG